jgi:seryl-tRNA synthetase
MILRTFSVVSPSSVGSGIPDEDIQKIADAVKSKLSEDIVKIINEKTAPLITKIDNLEKENRKLKNEVDVLEQYGRRSLIRISGIPEPTEEGDTTEKVRKIISDIDPRYEITNIIRSHRGGAVFSLIILTMSSDNLDFTASAIF